LSEHSAEVNLFELMNIARREFKMVKTLDEEGLARGWPRLRAALGKAFLNWQKMSVRELILSTEVAGIQCSKQSFWRQRFIHRE
jgi:hypothetical protein